MSGRIEIRVAELDNPRDLQATLALINEYAADPLGRARALDPETLKRVGQDLPHIPQARVFLAWEGSTPLGVAVCFLGYSTFGGGPLLNIHDLAVTQGARDRGVGRQLLMEIENYAQSLGCIKLTLEVRQDNPRARHLYASLGFDELNPPMSFWHKPLSRVR